MMEGLPEKVYTISAENALAKMNSDPKQGLDNQEVKRRLKQYGPNLLKAQKKKNVLLIFFEQFIDPVIYVLFAAAILGFAFGEYVEAFAVIMVIFLTACIGFFMEWQAIRSIEALKKMTESHATVLRNGKVETKKTYQLVPGDIILLEIGDVVPADARLLEHENLAVKEAALTGESMQVPKSIDILPENTLLPDRNNMVFSGTMITRGTAKALVTATGEATELGNISKLVQQAKEGSTPIEKRLLALSKVLIWLTLFLTILIAISGYLQGHDLKKMIETAIALAVAAIPEGLPIVATIALARGMLRLAKDRVIIKRLQAVETLGSTSIICTDKTGTLTENKMSAHTFLFIDPNLSLQTVTRDNINSHAKDGASYQIFIEIGILCNNVQINNETKIHGDPIEIALIELAQEVGYDISEIRKQRTEIVELPFDTETKMMATLNRYGNAFRVHAKGAPENLIQFCDKFSANGHIQIFREKQIWLQIADQLATQGLRVLAFAYRDVSQSLNAEELVEELTFLGLVGFIDPPRKDVKDAIKICNEAGIQVIMVTGDHPGTARSIAQAVGLIEESTSSEHVINGEELIDLAKLDEEEEKRLLNTSVFARVTPSQKLELVQFYQKHKFIVGMTGDGVNDAPALKKADIGIAMGIRGTEAAKEVADVILRDDQFSSIELGIRQGRTIFENIRNFVVYLLSCNLSEIITVALAALSNLPLPLLPLQILYLNLITDVFPALALGLGEGQKDIMKDPPRPTSEPILPQKLWLSIITYSIGITIGVLGITLFAHFHLQLEAGHVNNLAFYTLVLGQLVNVFNLPRSKDSFINNEVTRNPWVWGAIILCIALTLIGYLVTPLRAVLSLVPIQINHLGWVVVFSFVALLITQIIKRIGRI